MIDNESSSDEEVEGEVFEFGCPECGTHIVGEVSECPSCGVQFVIEEVHEYECSDCGALVTEEMEVCPECGVDLVPPSEEVEERPEEEPEEPVEEETTAEDFPQLVEEVRSKLELAKEYGLDTLRAKREIDKAVEAGRNKKFDSATKTVRKSMDILDQEISDRLESIKQRLQRSVDAADSIDEDPSEIKQAISSIDELMEKGDTGVPLRRVTRL